MHTSSSSPDFTNRHTIGISFIIIKEFSTTLKSTSRTKIRTEVEVEASK